MDHTKRYLGDGLYASDDGYQLCLSASNGIETHDEVYLDGDVLVSLFRYLEEKRNISITVKPKELQ